MGLREKFQIMRKIIMEQGEIDEVEFILLLDDRGIGQATYNKIKNLFRDNSSKVGINYNSKLKIYSIGQQQQTLHTPTHKQKEEMK